MTPGRKTNLHYVPWNGNIETHIDESRANSLLITETPDVSKILTAQIQRMTDAGVEGFRYALPTANGVVVSCDNPQQAYDAVYGLSNVVKFSSQQKTPVAANANGLTSIFGLEAQGNLHHAPKMHAMFDRATKGLTLDERTLDVPALAA